MAGNSFGQLFRITTAGESHGPANIVIIDGMPSGIKLSEKDLVLLNSKIGLTELLRSKEVKLDRVLKRLHY